MNERREVVRLCFKGGPYSEHVLDASALEAIVEFQEIVSDLAEATWKRKNPDRKKVPKSLRDSTRLVFRRIETGSAIVPLEMAAEFQRQSPLLLENTCDLTEAIDIAYNTFVAANSNERLPTGVPKNMLSKFAGVGKKLPNGVEMQLALPGAEMTPVSQTARQRFESLSVNNYQDSVQITGRVLEADVRKRHFQIWMDANTKVVVQFNEEQEDQVTTALKEHVSMRLRVSGKGEFNSEGKLHRVLNVEHLQLLSNEAEFDSKAPSIQKAIPDIFSDVSDSEWERLPSDLSHRHDFYLYGIDDP